MVDTAGTKEPVRVTYSDGFDGLPVPSPDGTQLAWTSSRAGGRRRADLPGAVESRSGDGGAQGRSAAPDAQRSTAHDARTHSHADDRSRRRDCRCVAASPVRRLRSDRHVVANAGARRRRSPPTSSKGGWPDRRANGSPRDYLIAELKRIGAKPLPGRPTSACRSSSPPARRTAARRSASTRAGADGADVRRRGQRAGAVVLRQRRSQRRRGVRRLRHRRARIAELRLRQLRDARRQGQGRRRAALLPRGRRPEDARRSSRATPTCATRRWRRGSAARRRMLVVTGPRSPNAGEMVR